MLSFISTHDAPNPPYYRTMSAWDQCGRLSCCFHVGRCRDSIISILSVASDEIGARLKFEFECILGLVHARARIPPNARSFCCLELLLCISFLRLLQCSISCGCNWGSWRSTQVRVYFLPPNLVRRSFCCSVWSSFFASPFVSSSMQLVSPSARQVKMQFRHFCSLCGECQPVLPVS